jgi:hypothetical protein
MGLNSVLAGASNSPAGEVRGIAPADVVSSSPRFAADDSCGAPKRLVLYSTEHTTQRLDFFVSLDLRRCGGR